MQAGVPQPTVVGNCLWLGHWQAREPSVAPVEQAFECLTQVMEEMPAVRHLQRSRCTECGSTGIFGRAVTRNNLYSGMLVQPVA